MKAILVDPSRFALPYDAGLSEGLSAAGVEVVWATRPLREGEIELLRPGTVREVFYRKLDRNRQLPSFLQKIAKGFAHPIGLWRLVCLALKERADVIHFQWPVLPILDAMVIAALRMRFRVVLTVHDTVPYNGERISLLQNLGFDLPMFAAQRLIVHTDAAADRLIERGHLPSKIEVVPHGPLSLPVPPRSVQAKDGNSPWIFTLFGQLKPYKGLDTLVRAVGIARNDLKDRAKIVVAGAAHMDLQPIRDEIRRLDVADLIDLRVGRLSEEEMADLFAETDCFLFPYRQIDASGVFYLTAPLGKWIVASDIGVFAEKIIDGRSGTLCAQGNSEALATALTDCARTRPSSDEFESFPSWQEIGIRTAELYRSIGNER
jgi:glycosyltransferase involved in cell wall biosynthesis